MNEQPDFMSVTVTVKVTPGQREAYAADADIPVSEATAHMRRNLSGTVDLALAESHTLREFTSYSVSDPV